MPMRVITVKMPEELVEALDEYCIRHGLSRSEAIRAAVTMLLIKQHQEQELHEFESMLDEEISYAEELGIYNNEIVVIK